MTDFLIKSSIPLITLLLVYFLLLEKEKMHQFNRFYLLFSLVFSFAIPFITIEIIEEITTPIIQNNTIQINQGSIVIVEETNYLPIILWSIYGLVTFLLSFRFMRNIIKIISKINSNTRIDYKNATLILLKEKVLPHTFLNYIFINEIDYNNQKIEAELFSHELTHVTQKHTFDVLFIEILKTIFWFNPIFIFYKKAIQLNHEFLADEKVVKSYNNIPFYQNLLISKVNYNSNHLLTSNLNYSLTKKRLIMMTKTVSKTKVLLCKIALLPLFSGLIFFMCIESVAQEKSVSSSKKTSKSDSSKDKKRDDYYAGVRVIVKDYTRNIMIDKGYEKLSLEEKRRYLGVPYPIKQNKLPPSNFESYKNSGKYAIWIDGINIRNNKLNNYKSSDFVHYTSSYIHKNARSKRFPQNFQCSLYTKKYFEENLKNSHLKYKNESITITFKKPEKISSQDSIKRVKIIQENMIEMKKDLLPHQNNSKQKT